MSTIAAEVVASVAFVPEYDWVTNTISELGVRHCTTDFDPRKGVEACSPLASLMNGAMVFSGTCLIMLAIVLRHSKGFTRWPGVLWALAGASSIATGFVTLDTDPLMHQIVSTPLFFGGPLAIILGAFHFRGGVRHFGTILGIVTLALGLLFSTTDVVFGYGGVVERLVIWASLSWVLFITVLARKDVLRGLLQRVPRDETIAPDTYSAGLSNSDVYTESMDDAS